MKKIGFNSDYKLAGDMLSYDGSPFISHYTKNGEHFICRWVDCNDKKLPYYHKWHFFKTSATNLKYFLDGNISLYMLIKSATNHSLIDLDMIEGDEYYDEKEISSFEDFSKEYLPSEDSYYDPEYYDDYCKTLKNNI